MAIIKRKISFYRLSLEKKTLVEDKNTVKITLLSDEEIYETFTNIYKNAVELKKGKKAVDVDTSNGKYVVEIIEVKDKKAFLKIGKQNASNMVELRDQNTLETQAVPMSDTQLLELYTFCYIDFDTCIISYIGINGAPKISAIRGLFQSNNINCLVASIVTNDIIKTLVKKNIISKISLTVAVPSDEILSDNLGLSEKDFDMFFRKKGNFNRPSGMLCTKPKVSSI